MTKIRVLLLPYNFYRWLDKASLIFDKTLKLAVSVKLSILRKIGGGGEVCSPHPPPHLWQLVFTLIQLILQVIHAESKRYNTVHSR